MDALSNVNLVALLLALLPGFLTAHIVAALVLREDRTAFDQIIRALIYTFLTHVIWSWCPWSGKPGTPTELLGLAIVSILLGLVLTFLINTGILHDLLRRTGITQAASRPNEWYDAFYEMQYRTVLHLHDGRRVFGWPRIYPVQPDKGHILLQGAEWLDRPGDARNIPFVDLLIDVKDIRFVEFVPPRIEE